MMKQQPVSAPLPAIVRDLARLEDVLTGASGHAALELLEVEPRRLDLDDVRSALARVARGTYGTCLECREPIATARLILVPLTHLCTACMSAEDVRERVLRDR